MKETLKNLRKKTVEKGSFGYLEYRKKINLIKVIVAFVIILIVFLSGIIATHTRNNIMTLMAVVLVLPGAKFAVGYMTVAKKVSASKELFDAVSKNATNLLACFDLIFANKQNLIGTQAVVVSDKEIFALTNEQKADNKLFETSLEEFMTNDKLKVKVHLFKDEKQFLKRIAAVNANLNSEDKAISDAIKWNVESLKNMCI